MTADERAALAREAERLKADETFRTVMATIRMEALERLAAISPTATNEIMEAQSIVRVSDGILTVLEQFILQGTERVGRTVA